MHHFDNLFPTTLQLRQNLRLNSKGPSQLNGHVSRAIELGDLINPERSSGNPQNGKMDDCHLQPSPTAIADVVAAWREDDAVRAFKAKLKR